MASIAQILAYNDSVYFPFQKENKELEEEIISLKKEIKDLKKEMAGMELVAGAGRWKTFLELEEKTTLTRQDLIESIKNMEKNGNKF